MIDGTTLCPHCNTSFRIEAAQLEVQDGMVRCGHCLQAFDARPGFIPDQPNPQLELPMLGDLFDELHAHERLQSDGPTQPIEAQPESETTEPTAADLRKATVLHSITLAEQVALVQDDDNYEPSYRKWPWILSSLMLLLILLAQAIFFYRVDITARFQAVKPAFVMICQFINCTISLPKDADLISIESSNMESDPAQENQITLVALLRNRATYPQAFPNLELTINDIDDKPLARRKFHPTEYLSSMEDEKNGLAPNQELNIKLHLNTSSLKPSGYRLALFYSSD